MLFRNNNLVWKLQLRYVGLLVQLFVARFLKYVWPFYKIMHERVRKFWYNSTN